MKNFEKSSQRVLVLALSGIGNFIMQSPVFEALKKNGYEVTCWVAPRGTRELSEHNQYIDHVIEAPVKQGIVGHVKLTLMLSKDKFNIGVVLHPGQHWKSAGYLFLAGIGRRIGITYPFRGNSASGFLLTDAVEATAGLHDIEQNLRLLKPLGITHQTTHYSLPISDSARHDAAMFLKQHDLHGKKVIGFHAGSSPDLQFKRWPLENFAIVGKSLAEKYGYIVLLFGGPDEEKQKEELYRKIGKDHSLSVSASLLVTAAIMQQCRFVLSNDSGLMHLAAAAGVITYGLFGPTDEGRTGPRGTKSIIIRADATRPVYEIDSNFFLGPNPHPSILAITPQLVIDTISRTDLR